MSWDGSKIKERAREVRLSLVNLAEKLGVSRQTINLWMRGKVPRGQHLVKLCKVLDTNPAYFFTQEMEELVSVPRHRTVKKKIVTDEMLKESKKMADDYINLFRAAPSSNIIRVVRINERERNRKNAENLANQLRKISGIQDDKPMDFEHTFRLIDELGIYIIFRSFPKTTTKHIYAFYSRICNQRVIFVNINTNIIDLIFPLLHDTIHAIRDEESHLINDQYEEDFCDLVANYIQFSEQYINLVANTIEGLPPQFAVNKLKYFAKEHAHSLFGIQEAFELFNKKIDFPIGGAATNFKKTFQTLGQIILQNDDPADYIKWLEKLSPRFMKLVKEQVPDCSLRKLAEWLGLDNSIDAKAVMDIIQNRK